MSGAGSARDAALSGWRTRRDTGGMPKSSSRRTQPKCAAPASWRWASHDLGRQTSGRHADACGCRLVRQFRARDHVSVTVQTSGTVTLVFTDIEGSTALLDELGAEAFKEALGDHRRALRDAFGAHSGYEVDDAGDGLFYAFASGSEAVTAVAEAMASLAEGPVRIRVGVHTGEPLLDPPKYVGPDVHKAARIMSAAHGGQVLLSGATRELVAEDVLDLGRHRLKDFAGPGGTGKTRLAVEAAGELVSEFGAGVFWIGLAPVRDPELVVDTIAQTLGAKQELAAHIGEKQLLLVLDNLEQVVESAVELAALLRACS